MKLNNQEVWLRWLKIIILLIALIILLIGFLIGYFYGDKSCIEDPLRYGVQKLNEVNEDNFICSCTPTKKVAMPFYFDETGIIIEK